MFYVHIKCVTIGQVMCATVVAMLSLLTFSNRLKFVG